MTEYERLTRDIETLFETNRLGYFELTRALSAEKRRRILEGIHANGPVLLDLLTQRDQVADTRTA